VDTLSFSNARLLVQAGGDRIDEKYVDNPFDVVLTEFESIDTNSAIKYVMFVPFFLILSWYRSIHALS